MAPEVNFLQEIEKLRKLHVFPVQMTLPDKKRMLMTVSWILNSVSECVWDIPDSQGIYSKK